MACYLCCHTLGLAVTDNLEGLYEKRVELLKKYEQDVGHDYLKNKEKADIYKKQIEAIDQKYREVIHEMFFAHERKEYTYFKKYCDGKVKDGYFFFICKLIAYYRDGNSVSLLTDIPVTKYGLADLWEIDKIILSDHNYFSKPHPKLFDKASFVFLFLDAIYQLAANKDEIAIDKFFTIEKVADGEYGEYMEYKILNLFEDHPEIIIKNWGIVKRYKSTIGFETTDYHSKANTIIQNYQNVCEKLTVDSAICKEIIEFLQLEKGK
jgi:hypothetical protein